MSAKTLLDRILKLFPFGIVAGLILIFLLLELQSADGFFFFYVPLAMIASVILILWTIFSSRPPRLLTLLALVILCTASFELLQKHDEIRMAMRWVLWSKEFKVAVLAQPSHYPRELRHIEWDAWGWGGSGATIEYLVFNPDDSLAKAVESKPDDMVFTPLPGSVAKIHRLEKFWYAVVFYTGTTWHES